MPRVTHGFIPVIAGITPAERRALEQLAERRCATLGQTARYLIRQGLEADGVLEPLPIVPVLAEPEPVA